MSDTTPTSPAGSNEGTPPSDENAREGANDGASAAGGLDPADITDTASVERLPEGYRPVPAAEHVAPEPAVPSVADAEPELVAEPESAPAAEPEPVAEPEPLPEPELAVESAPEPEPAAQPEQVAEPEPEPVAEAPAAAEPEHAFGAAPVSPEFTAPEPAVSEPTAPGSTAPEFAAPEPTAPESVVESAPVPPAFVPPTAALVAPELAAAEPVAEVPVAEAPVAETAAVETPPVEAPIAGAAAQASVAPAPYPGYLPAPVPPKKKSNRRLGILIAVLGVVVFAVLDAAAAYGILALHYGASQADGYLTDYLKGWEFWIPLAVFAAASIALVAIVNRSRWWTHILGSIFVAAFVFAGYFGAALVTNRIWEHTPDEFRTFVSDYFEAKVPIPYLWIAIAATFIALEVVTWLGAWIAYHGQKAKRRNAEAKAGFDAQYGPAALR